MRQAGYHEIRIAFWNIRTPALINSTRPFALLINKNAFGRIETFASMSFLHASKDLIHYP